MSHNFGAVQNAAPHASGAGHCFDEQDVMCYIDGGPYFVGGGALTHDPVHCSGSDFLFSEQYDCNQDDYFNPTPAGGSYLATNWNSFDSVYLCLVDDCDTDLTAPTGASLQTTHGNGTLALAGSVATGAIANYEWDVDGDGYYDYDTGATASLAPVWDTPGSRTIRMRASKADGSFALATLGVAPVTPLPSFTIKGNFVAGATLQLDGTATSDPDGLITKFLWDLNGDGGYETDTGLTRTTSTSFAAAGQYSVGLEVDYPFGASFARTQPFTISAAAGSQTGTPTGGTPTTTATVVAAPTLAIAKVKLGKLIRSGLPFVVTCGASCTVKFTLAVDARTAKKLRLKGKAGKSVVIGRLSATLAKGTAGPRLKLTAAARRALKKARSLKAKLAGSVAQGTTAPLKVSKALTFKR